MTDRKAAETMPPGEFLRDEMEARGWTQADLAAILGRPVRAVNEIAMGRKAITPATARELGAAFGTDAWFWMNLEAAYRLARAQEPDPEIGRRARLYALAPIAAMQKRGWIGQGGTTDDLERAILQFYEASTLDEIETMTTEDLLRARTDTPNAADLPRPLLSPSTEGRDR
jgi:HTH-type transcriptional regulator/antitoxin HigA